MLNSDRLARRLSVLRINQVKDVLRPLALRRIWEESHDTLDIVVATLSGSILVIVCAFAYWMDIRQ